MTPPAHAGRGRPRPGRWWTLTAVLLVVGTCCLAAGLTAHRDGLAVATTSPTGDTPAAGPGQPAPTPPPVTALVVARSTPVSLSIPAIGVTVPLSSLGLNPDGTVQVPTDYQEPGWFRLGPTPGQVGSSVILGHVDSYQGPAVFFQLRSLQPGDQVDVLLSDGVDVQFAVDTVATYLKSQFPAQEVYGSHGVSALQLVTCGGQFDGATGGYLSNVVVYTSLVAATPAAATTSPVRVPS